MPEAESRPSTCATCRFYIKDSESGQGVCHYNPPSPSFSPEMYSQQPGKIITYSPLWPIVKSWQFCGQFQHRHESPRE